jgi:ribosomal protein S18 acetylase RimI-like enzyme
VTLCLWRPDLADATAAMLARTFAGNPLHLAAFGPDRVVARNEVFFRVALSILTGRRVVALDGARVVGFAHAVASPACHVPIRLRMSLLPAMLRGFGVGGTLRVSSWLSAWARHNPAELHWHVGPIGVDPDWQRRGVGRALMSDVCAAIDGAGAPGFLETDKPENVAFYRAFGFEVVREAPVIGVTTFFMARRAQA